MPKWTRRAVLQTGLGAVAAPQPLLQTASPAGSSDAPSPREKLLLDFGWKFHLGHAGDSAKDFGYGGNAGGDFAKSGAFVPPGDLNFDDSAWRPVDLPHDWAVELPFENAKPLMRHGSKPLGRAYPETSIGWYRRVFSIPADDLGRRLRLEFDGVYRDAIVIFNGHYLCRNMSGYAPFEFDITDFANFGGANTLVLRVDATLNEGWFYEGAGIYRHVWLTKTHPLHVGRWGVFVRSSLANGSANLAVTTEICNQADVPRTCRLVSTVVDAEGRTVAATQSEAVKFDPWKQRAVEQQMAVERPRLWSLEQPTLYSLVSTLEIDGAVVDRYETPFGIRTIAFDADRGFFLNGRPVKIKGTCNHQDHAGLGTALPDAMHAYRLGKLKEMGSNAYRCSHNPPAPELLDACDRLGMLVMDETRMMSSNPEGLSQLSRMMRRDRNHPSIIIWALGNEEREQGTERGARIVRRMKQLARELDPTRPVTVPMNHDWGKGVSTAVDVQGLNYFDSLIDGYRAQFPKQPLIGAETASTECTRGIYENDRDRGYVSAYDANRIKACSTAEEWWTVYSARPFLAGGFAWTGFDYRGEPSPYGWPCISSHFGIMDTCGFPKDNYFYYKAWWSGKPVLHLFPHWNWPGREGREIEVWCHTNLDRVELRLNGKSLGAQNVARNSHVMWKVPYTPGVLEAVGFADGRQSLVEKRITTGPAATIVLRANRDRIRADGEDVAVIEVSALDAAGLSVPVADNEITFEVTGAGKLIGVGNGDPSSHEPDKGTRRRLFNGLATAIVQAGKTAGEITITASSAGLSGASVRLVVEKVNGGWASARVGL